MVGIVAKLGDTMCICLDVVPGGLEDHENTRFVAEEYPQWHGASSLQFQHEFIASVESLEPSRQFAGNSQALPMGDCGASSSDDVVRVVLLRSTVRGEQALMGDDGSKCCTYRGLYYVCVWPPFSWPGAWEVFTTSQLATRPGRIHARAPSALDACDSGRPRERKRQAFVSELKGVFLRRACRRF